MVRAARSLLLVLGLLPLLAPGCGGPGETLPGGETPAETFSLAAAAAARSDPAALFALATPRLQEDLLLRLAARGTFVVPGFEGTPDASFADRTWEILANHGVARPSGAGAEEAYAALQDRLARASGRAKLFEELVTLLDACPERTFRLRRPLEVKNLVQEDDGADGVAVVRDGYGARVEIPCSFARVDRRWYLERYGAPDAK